MATDFLGSHRQVIEIERITFNVFCGRHVGHSDDLTLNSRETTRPWEETEPQVEKGCPVLALEGRLFLMSNEREENFYRGRIPGR